MVLILLVLFSPFLNFISFAFLFLLRGLLSLLARVGLIWIGICCGVVVNMLYVSLHVCCSVVYVAFIVVLL